MIQNFQNMGINVIILKIKIKIINRD